MSNQAILLTHECLIPLPASFTVVQAVGFKQEFQKTCEDNPDLTTFVFDFSKTNFMDSSGIGALVGCWKIAQKRGIRLVLRNVSPQVMSILSLADLGRLFEIEQKGQKLKRSRQSKSPPLQELPFVTHPSVKSRTKRLIDIAGALVGLTITAVLFVPIVIAIKLDSPGPIFFGQERCSWMGRRFRMWKFRSMVTDAEKLKHLVENQACGAILRTRMTPGLPGLGGFSGAPAWMSCPSSGMC